MKRFIPILMVASLLAFGSMTTLPVSAAAPKTVSMKFQLQVVGNSDTTATYWVAFGPVGGKFGIFELFPVGHSQFSASRTFQFTGHAMFTYLVGHGTVRTKLGLEPGGPIFVIKSTGMLSVAGHRSITVEWHQPQG